jgi:hypothetical protein
MPLDDIKAQINKNAAQRLKKDADKAPQHTIYLGDRTVQRLGEEPIKNAVILPNKALSIGEPLLPLASGDVLRRYDSVNRGAYLGSAYRKALEADGITGAKLSMNGDNAMPDEPLSPQLNGGGDNGSFPPISPPPFGCAPPDKKCFWSTASIAPNGFQGYGDVVASTGERLFLYCAIGTTPPSDLGCEFLRPNKWSCSGGVCSLDANGIYNSQAECEAALIPPPYLGGQCSTDYKLQIGVTYTTGGILGYYTNSGSSPTELTTAQVLADGIPFGGAITSIELLRTTPASEVYRLWVNGIASAIIAGNDGGNLVTGFVLITLIRADGGADNCGNLPSTCP